MCYYWRKARISSSSIQTSTTEAATIHASETVTFEEIEEAIEQGQLNKCIRTLSQTLTFLPTYTPKDDEEAKKFRQGQVFPTFAEMANDAYIKIEQSESKGYCNLSKPSNKRWIDETF